MRDDGDVGWDGGWEDKVDHGHDLAELMQDVAHPYDRPDGAIPPPRWATRPDLRSRRHADPADLLDEGRARPLGEAVPLAPANAGHPPGAPQQLAWSSKAAMAAQGDERRDLVGSIAELLGVAEQTVDRMADLQGRTGVLPRGVDHRMLGLYLRLSRLSPEAVRRLLIATRRARQRSRALPEVPLGQIAAPSRHHGPDQSERCTACGQVVVGGTTCACS